jgi:hypothetical protein
MHVYTNISIQIKFHCRVTTYEDRTVLRTARAAYLGFTQPIKVTFFMPSDVSINCTSQLTNLILLLPPLRYQPFSL